MGDYTKKIQSDNKHLSNQTSARYAHVPASTTKTVRSSAGRLLRVVLNTNGGAVTLRDGSDVIGIIAADAAENTFYYGIYCNNSIVCEAGATSDVTVVFDE
jgi:hypothetical protein